MSSTEPTFGQLCTAQLLAAKEASGVKLTPAGMAGIIDALLKAEGYRQPRKRVAGRDPLFDAFAEALGYNPREITTLAGPQIGTALASILAVCENPGPAEFKARVWQYRQLHPDWECTPLAIATWWPELGLPERREAEKPEALDTATEPEGWAQRISPALFYHTEGMAWGEISEPLRRRIVRELLVEA